MKRMNFPRRKEQRKLEAERRQANVKPENTRKMRLSKNEAKSPNQKAKASIK